MINIAKRHLNHHALPAILLILISFCTFGGAEIKAQEESRDAQAAPIVIELFTSIDCLACLRAESIFNTLAQQENVIALACHIDQWDSENVSDFSIKECEYRQWAYKDSRMIEDTKLDIPYLVLNGQTELSFWQLDQLNMFLERVKNIKRLQPFPIDVDWVARDTLEIKIPEQSKYQDHSYNVWLLRYRDGLIKKIEEGENAGRIVKFTNLVEEINQVTKWNGLEKELTVKVGPPPGGKLRGGYAVLIQRLNGDRVIGAGKVIDYPVDNTGAQN